MELHVISWNLKKSSMNGDEAASTDKKEVIQGKYYFFKSSCWWDCSFKSI